MDHDLSLKGQFLIAMPSLTGSYFGDALIYLCEHNADGALGLMVNRPTDMSLFELAAHIGIDRDNASLDVPILEGGPVGRERGFVLHAGSMQFSTTTEVSDDQAIALSTDREAVAALAGSVCDQPALITMGYAGWDAGQLEGEIAENTWLTCPADPAILFEAPFADRVNLAASTLGIDFRLMSGTPGYA